MEYYSAIQMDLEINIVSEVKSDGERQIYRLYVESKKKNDRNEFIYKLETDSQTQKANIWLTKRKGMWGRKG